MMHSPQRSRYDGLATSLWSAARLVTRTDRRRERMRREMWNKIELG
jgi:hypothetical protein